MLPLSEDGLKNKTNILENCCRNWSLEINIIKNKIMIFNKQGKHRITVLQSLSVRRFVQLLRFFLYTPK